jgi:hypothetical protein
MAMREELPARRGSVTVDFVHTNPALAQTEYTAMLGYYDDGRLGEIFINSAKVGTDVDVQVKDAAKLLSFAFQYGVPLEELRATMTRSATGAPEGVIGTLLDLISADPELRGAPEVPEMPKSSVFSG